MKPSAAISFTKEKFTLEANGDFGKVDTSFMEENETTVSVTWTGGGQDLKKRKTLRETMGLTKNTDT